ncbi:DUF4114 domain-containing protein [Cyanobium sp. WAJ14-Wanaka]|uniref:DUF4114 domain-containing protein n=1 Tax=Cyanobium sp. WAJ14-Wanaka TaxID=2823725 RepID=UPI0020CBB2B3|nr:DUF4114 domain-containing protein [Cyanobium sp. WAJ14-Wanaka]MCP9774103.1 DUF4114 domain-containing protein [Cyanobium sp. WAJ14-Wanaka]
MSFKPFNNMATDQMFKPLGPAPIQDPFRARLSIGNPWGSGIATGAVSSLFMVQDNNTKDGILYAGAAGGGVWGRPYTGATDAWGQWTWLSGSNGYEGAQSISKIKVSDDNKWLISGQGATSSFGDLSGLIDKPLQVAERLAGGSLKWIANVGNSQENLKGKAITSLEIADDIVVAGTKTGLFIGSIDLEGKLTTLGAAANLSGSTSSNISSIAKSSSGRLYAAVIGKGIYTSTISELSQAPLREWKLIDSSETLCRDKSMLRVATSKDPATGKDILFLATASASELYDSINKVIYDEKVTNLIWQKEDVLGRIGNGQATIHSSFASNPINPEQVFAGGNWGPGEFKNGTWVTTYLGATGAIVATDFSGIQPKFTNLFPSKEEDKNSDGTAPHADSRDIAFMQTLSGVTRIIESDDGGIYIKDLGTSKDIDTTKPWKGLNDGLRITESFSSDWSSIGNLAITAMQDNATAVGRFGNQPGWLNVTGGDGAIARFDDGIVGSDGISRAYFASQQYGARGIVEQNSYDHSGTLLSSDFLNLSIIDKYRNFQDWFDYENTWYGAAAYPFYHPAETSEYRAGDIVFSGMRNIYEQVFPHWQSVTLGEMLLVSLIAEDTDKPRYFTEVAIGSNQAFQFKDQKPYSWDALYASFLQSEDVGGTPTPTAKLFGRKASASTQQDWFKNVEAYQLKDLSANLPKVVQGNTITGIAFNPNNPDEIWATVASTKIAYIQQLNRPTADYFSASYLIYSPDGGLNWSIAAESGKNGIPATASLQQVVYAPKTESAEAELFLSGYGGAWRASVGATNYPSTFKPVGWQGAGDDNNFNMWITNLEYDLKDDLVIASVMAQGAWLLSRSNKELEQLEETKAGFRINEAIIPQDISTLRNRKKRSIFASIEISLQRSENNLDKEATVELVLPSDASKYLQPYVNEENIINSSSNRYLFRFPSGVNEISVEFGSNLNFITLPDKLINFKLENATNATIADGSGSIFLYATTDMITLNQEVEGVFYSNKSGYETDEKLPSQAQQLAILMPRANLKAGEQLFWYPVNSDGSIQNGQIAIKPKDPSYLNLAKSMFSYLATSRESYDSHALSPEKALEAFSNPSAILSSEGISIGDLATAAGTTLPSADRFALALQDIEGNVRLSTLGFSINSSPELDNSVVFGAPGIGSQVVLAPGEGQLFMVDELTYYAASNAGSSNVDFNLDVARFSSNLSGYGLFRVDNTYGHFLFGDKGRLTNPLEPGSVEYAREAFRRSQTNTVDGITGLPIPGFAQTSRSSIQLAKGNSYSLFITPNQVLASPDQIDSLSEILFSVKEANLGKDLQHVSFGTGYFAFEDMGLRGDRDFNDMLFAITPVVQPIV